MFRTFFFFGFFRAAVCLLPARKDRPFFYFLSASSIQLEDRSRFYRENFLYLLELPTLMFLPLGQSLKSHVVSDPQGSRGLQGSSPRYPLARRINPSLFLAALHSCN